MITFIEVEIRSSIHKVIVYRVKKSPLKNGMTDVRVYPVGTV